MAAEMWTALSAVAVSGVTAFGTVWVAKAGRRTAEAGRRTAEQEQRDNFSTFTKALHEDLSRVKADLAEQKAEAAAQRRLLLEHESDNRYLLRWVRSLYGHMRQIKVEPPAPPQPIPPGIQQAMQDIGV